MTNIADLDNGWGIKRWKDCEKDWKGKISIG